MNEFAGPYITIGLALFSLLIVLSIWFHVGRISRNTARMVTLLEQVAARPKV